MKKNLSLLFVFLCAITFFTACSDDDDKNTYEDLNATYSGEKLLLNYSDKALLGKEVVFSTTDGSKATLTMKGAKANMTLPIVGAAEFETAGVIPGELSTVLNVDLTGTDGKYAFEGTDEANGRKIVYKGSIEAGKLMLNLNVTMPTNDLVGQVWDLNKYESDWGSPTSTPFHIVWTSSEIFNVDVMGTPIPMPMETLLGFVAHNLLWTDANINADQLILSVLRDVTFQADGNIVASYSDAANMAKPSFVSSPINIAQYYVKSGKLYLLLNPDAIMKLVPAAATRAADINTALQQLIQAIAPMVANGIPLTYTKSDDKVAVYLDTTFLKSVLDIAMPLLKDPDIVALIVGAMANTDFASYAGTIEQFPRVYEATTKMELGLNLVKHTNAE